MTAEAPSSRAQTTRGAGQLFVDLGPVIVFVLSYNVLRGRIGDDAIFWATGLFMIATFAAIGYAWMKTRHIPPVLWITGALVLIFGGLTIVLRDRTFVIIKPIFVYLFYAGAIFGAHLLGFNLWKLLFGHAFTLPDRIWRILALRWGAFFLFMAALSAFFWLSVEVWGTMSEDFWVQSRLFVTFPLVFLFALLNVPITLKHIGAEARPAPADPAKSGDRPTDI